MCATDDGPRMQAKEGFSKVGDGTLQVNLFIFENMSSSNLATALAESISPIVALSLFRWVVECHFKEQKLQPRSVFKLELLRLLFASNTLANRFIVASNRPQWCWTELWAMNVQGGFMLKWLEAIVTWFTESSLFAQWNQPRYCAWACTGDSLFGTKTGLAISLKPTCCK